MDTDSEDFLIEDQVKNGGSNVLSSELMEMLHRLQSARLDDQRCQLPFKIRDPVAEQKEADSIVEEYLKNVICGVPPFPAISVFNKDKYWIEEFSEVTCEDMADPRHYLNPHSNESYSIYKNEFCGLEHFNFYGYDENQGPFVLSILLREITDDKYVARSIARFKTGSLHRLVKTPEPIKAVLPTKILELSVPDLKSFQYQPAVCPRASKLILKYDEHEYVKNLKFGLIYQGPRQVTEEDFFGNQDHTPEFERFMRLLGDIVPLKGYKGYSGGLDVKHDSTGTHFLRTTFENYEVAFHVTTLLPYVKKDRQQVQRKCHIGNDIVTLVFQDSDETTFSPESISSNFLQAFVVVRQLDDEHYKVYVTAKQDVPEFAPRLPHEATFQWGEHFRNYLLTKLITAEKACYKSQTFNALQQRTRKTLLVGLSNDLKKDTSIYVPQNSTKFKIKGTTAHSKFIWSMKKALSGSAKNVHQKPSEGTKELHAFSDNDNSVTLRPGKLLRARSSLEESLAQDQQTSPINYYFPTVPNAIEAECKTQNPSTFRHVLCKTDSMATITSEVIVEQSIAMEQEVARLRMDKLNLFRQVVSLKQELDQVKNKTVVMYFDNNEEEVKGEIEYTV